MAVTTSGYDPGGVADPLGDFATLLHAVIPTANMISSPNEIAQRGCFLYVHTAPHRHNVASNSPNPVPNAPGIGTKFGSEPLQNVSTTIATLIAFPVKVIELGTILQVILFTGLVQVSCTVPVVPGKAVSTNPNTALLPGVVVTEELPCPIPIVTGLELLNVAVTAVAAVTVTAQAPIPAHPPPLQPAKVDPVAAEAVKVTCVPLAKFAEQVAGQLIPAGALVTVPVPVPASITDNAKPLVLELKVAVTVVAAVNVTTHVPVPVQPPPLHPAKVEPSAGLAVRVTCAPLAKLAEHVDPQLIPAGVLATVPEPVPAFVTVRVKPLPKLKVAVTVTIGLIGTVHVGGFVCGFAGAQLVLKLANDDPSPRRCRQYHVAVLEIGRTTRWTTNPCRDCSLPCLFQFLFPSSSDYVPMRLSYRKTSRPSLSVPMGLLSPGYPDESVHRERLHLPMTQRSENMVPASPVPFE